MGLHPQLFLEVWHQPITSRCLEDSSHLVVQLTFNRISCDYVLEPSVLTTGWFSLLRPCWLLQLIMGAGMLTCLPSPTPVGLGLGTD